MTEQKTTFVQWHAKHGGLDYYYYAPLGEAPGQPGWGSPKVVFQLWRDEAAGRVAIKRGIKQQGEQVVTSIGTEEKLNEWGFGVQGGPIGYALPAADSYSESDLLLATNPPNYFTTSASGISSKVTNGWTTEYTGVAIPRIQRVDVHAGVGPGGEFQAIVHADNGLANDGYRSGDLSVFAGGGVFFLCFHGGVSLVEGSLSITNLATGSSALGSGLEFQLLPEEAGGLPRSVQTSLIHDDGLAVGTTPDSVEYEYAFQIEVGGQTHTVDPKIINRSTSSSF